MISSHAPCIDCGRMRRVQRRRADGPLCAGCALRRQRNAETLIQRVRLASWVAEIEPGLTRGVVESAVGEAAPTNRHVLALYNELAGDRGILLTPTVWAPKVVSELMVALSMAGAKTITMPRCVSCGYICPRDRRSGGAERFCRHCHARAHPVQCTDCGEVRPRARFVGDRQPVCTPCLYVRKHPVTESGGVRQFPMSRGCITCGRKERRVRKSRCATCAGDYEWTRLAADTTAHLTPDRIAALGREVTAQLNWRALCHPVAKDVMHLLQSPDGLTEDTLDALARSQSSGDVVAGFRAAFVGLDMLAARDEHVARLALWAKDRIRKADLGANRAAAERFAQWWVIRRARQRHDRSWLSDRPHRQIRASLQLLAWLHSQSISLDICQQHDIDRWTASHRPRAPEARAFVRWAVRNHLADGISILREPRQQPVSKVGADRQKELVAALLNNTDAPAGDRLAGLLVALYGQLLTRIMRMPRTAVIVGADGAAEIRLGSEPIAVSGPVGALAAAQVAAAQEVASPWLFPSPEDPRRHVSKALLGTRVRALGITAAVRTSGLVDLARQLPAPVLRDALGMHGNTAARWAAAAGGSWAGYVALRQGSAVASYP